VEERTKRDFGAVLHYVAPREIQLKGGELGVARGAVVTVMDAVALDVDAEGNVISSNHHKVDRGQEQRIHDHVTKLVERGRVYAAQPGESVDPGLLIERKQPYYIAYDQEGKKRIQRGFIACYL
jgi:hypothetical protein